MNANDYIEISVLIPCYNSAESVDELTERLVHSMESLAIPYEIIFINDCSSDNTLQKLCELAEKHSMVSVIDLMYNVGQFRALMCGFEQTRGQYVITMDDDLQHPPEEIEKLYTHIKSRDDLDGVIGKYDSIKYSLYRNLGRKLVNKIDKWVFGKSSDLESTSFRCLKRDLVEALIQNRTRVPILGALIKKSSHRLENIMVHHNPRQHGKSNYGLNQLIRNTYDYIFNFSSIPLKFISIIGGLMASISAILTIFYLFRYFMGGIGVAGWTTVVLLLNLYSGLLLLSISIVGEYLIRILNEVNHQPRFHIRKTYGIAANDKGSL